MEASDDKESIDGTSRTMTLAQQTEKELQAMEGSTSPETSEHIQEDNAQPLIQLEMINSSRLNLSSSLPGHSSASSLENGVNENSILTLPEANWVNKTLSESMQLSMDCKSPFTSESTIPSESSVPLISTTDSPKYIFESSRFDGFPVVSSVFSLQGHSAQPTALTATEPKRTKTPSPLIDQHPKREPKSSGKKKLDEYNIPIKPMPLHVASLQLTERQISSVHECTLLKFLETHGGFFKGRKEFTTMGLKAIFTALQTNRTELTFQDLTKKCYTMFERKMMKLEKSKVKVFLEVLDSFLYLFDWYCHKNWPVITVAMYIYLPNAIDYSYYTWHGICPTGWSEYCCAVIIREVIQFILDNAMVSSMLPLYSPAYFSLPSIYSSKLLPRLLPTAQNDDMPSSNTASCNSFVHQASTQTSSRPSNTSTLQTSATQSIPMLPKLDSNQESTNEQLDEVSCKDALYREPGPQDVKDIGSSCERNSDTASPKEDVPIDGKCNNSSSSLKTTDANVIEKNDETCCLDGVNVAMTVTTAIKNEDLVTVNEKKRKRDYFSCYIDESENEGQNGPNNHIKIRIVKKSCEEDLDFNSSGKIELLCTGTGNGVKDLGQSLPSNAQVESVRSSQETNGDSTSLAQMFETGDQQKDQNGKKEVKAGEGNDKLVWTAPHEEVTDSVLDVKDSDVKIVESQVTSDKEDRGHEIETIENTSRNTKENILNHVVSHSPANQEVLSVTVTQNSSPKDSSSGHCNDNKLFTNEIICKRSRLFDALWSNRTPLEPRIHMLSGSCMSLGEFLERYPLATTCIPEGTTIEIDSNKHDASEILNNFCTGVSFCCHKPFSLNRRYKTCYSLATVDEGSYVTHVKPIPRSSIRAVIPQKKKKSLPAPHQNIYNEMCVEKIILNSHTETHINKETVNSQNDCNQGDGNTKDTSSKVQGNTQPTQEHLSKSRELLQQIDHLRKTANFLNELATGLEVRLTSLNDTGK